MSYEARKYLCLICGYDELDTKPTSHEICPCCGTQFAYNDFVRSHEELRKCWIERDKAQWWSIFTPPPPGWNAEAQLKNVMHLKAKDQE